MKRFAFAVLSVASVLALSVPASAELSSNETVYTALGGETIPSLGKKYKCAGYRSDGSKASGSEMIYDVVEEKSDGGVRYSWDFKDENNELVKDSAPTAFHNIGGGRYVWEFEPHEAEVKELFKVVTFPEGKVIFNYFKFANYDELAKKHSVAITNNEQDEDSEVTSQNILAGKAEDIKALIAEVAEDPKNLQMYYQCELQK